MLVNEQELANDGLTLEDLVPDPPAINTELILESTQKTFEMFRECRQYDLPAGNPFFEPRVLTIRENEDKFQRATKESIKQSEHLTEYAADLVRFAEFCIDPDNTADDLLEGARSVLDQAKSNNRKASEILKEYLAIANGLARVREEVEGHRADITNAENSIERNEQESSEEENRLEEATRNRERKSSWIKGGAFYAKLGGTIALIVTTLPVASFVLAEETLTSAVFGKTAFDHVTDLVQYLYTIKDRKQIRLSSEKIEELRVEMEGLKEIVEGSIETVDKLTRNLKQIIELVTVFESFWQRQVVSLEHVVKKMEARSNAEEQSTIRPLSKFDALSVKSKWKAIKEEHHLYTEALNRITVQSQIQ